jgi:hypothetical protein
VLEIKIVVIVKIVYAKNMVSIIEESFRKVKANKTGSAGNECVMKFKMHVDT